MENYDFPIAVKKPDLTIKKVFLSFKEHPDDTNYRVCNCHKNWQKLVDNYIRLEANGACEIEAHYILTKTVDKSNVL